MNFDRFNDGSQNPPRLRLHHGLWGLMKLPMNAALNGQPEWTLDEKCALVKAQGFEAMECFFREDEAERQAAPVLERHELRVVLGHRPFNLDDVRQTVERGVRLKADFIFAQPASAFTPLEDVIEIAVEGRKMANDAGMAFFVETHRNNWTETLPQTLQLLEWVPDIRLTADLSHFVVVGEFYGWEQEGAIDKMAPVLERASHAHGRISNGEAVQVDVGDGSGQTAQFFVALWTRAMREWLKGAGPGDVFPFATETWPAALRHHAARWPRVFRRWEQSLVMKKLAEQAWQQAQEAA